MAERVLTRRELNRALLARQSLLERQLLSAAEMIERLVGLQAEKTMPPSIGLWTRLRDFERDDLAELLQQRQVVRATMMRSTLHLVTVADYVRLRPVIQPALSRALRLFYGKKAAGLNIERLVVAARPYLEESPRTLTQLRAFLAQIEPERDPETMAYAVRTHLPLVQTPPGGSPAYAVAESWLGQTIAPSDDLRELIFRYLAAFGPATVKDIQAWSGLVKLKDAVEMLRAELRVYRDEDGKELFDLPDAPLSDADTPAPVRFLPEFDNAILSYADRRRMIADEDRAKVFLSAGRVAATFLVDGFVRGVWKVEGVALLLQPFDKLTKAQSDELREEGERLGRFIGDEIEVRFAE